MPLPAQSDKEKIAEVALALMYLTLHGDEHAPRAWKGMDWDVLDLLFERGWISNPKSKAKSVLLTPEGLKAAPGLFDKHLTRSG